MHSIIHFLKATLQERNEVDLVLLMRKPKLKEGKSLTQGPTVFYHSWDVIQVCLSLSFIARAHLLLAQDSLFLESQLHRVHEASVGLHRVSRMVSSALKNGSLVQWFKYYLG